MPETRSRTRQISRRAEIHEAEAYLDGVAERLGKNGVKSQSVVAAGDAAQIIVEEAALHQVNLIVLSTHGRSGVGRRIYGSVAEQVLADSKVPILLVRIWKENHVPITATVLRRILVPLDGSPLAEIALPWAVELARLFSAQLDLLSVIPPVGLVGLSEYPGIDEIPFGADDGHDEEATASYLDAIAAAWRQQGLSVTTSSRVARPATGIVTAASDRGADLVVMATHGRTGLTRTLLGSVALEVLHRGSLPVLLVRPPPDGVARK